MPKELDIRAEQVDAYAEAFMELGRQVTRSLAEMASALPVFEPPKNLPHDPSLRKDRRKWGGR